MRKKLVSAVLILAAAAATAATTKDPFVILANRWLWAIEEVSRHQKPGEIFNDVPPPKVEMRQEAPATSSSGKASSKSAKAEKKSREPIIRNFKTTTAWAALSATITDYGDKFTVQVTSDQPVMGWALKKQSDKKIFLKGAVNGHTTFAFDVKQPYIRDFGLTVYVTDNSYPAFLPLYE